MIHHFKNTKVNMYHLYHLFDLSHLFTLLLTYHNTKIQSPENCRKTSNSSIYFNSMTSLHFPTLETCTIISKVTFYQEEKVRQISYTLKINVRIPNVMMRINPNSHFSFYPLFSQFTTFHVLSTRVHAS